MSRPTLPSGLDVVRSDEACHLRSELGKGKKGRKAEVPRSFFVTSSKALVTTSEALVPRSFFVTRKQQNEIKQENISKVRTNGSLFLFPI